MRASKSDVVARSGFFGTIAELISKTRQEQTYDFYTKRCN